MKIFTLTAFVGSVTAAKKGNVAAAGPSTRFTDPNHVSVPHPNPKATECSHTRCMMISQPTPYGVHEVMNIIHDNLESKCAKYETVSTNSGLANHAFHANRKVHCGRVKRWATTTAGTTQSTVGHTGGHFIYDGPCECHVAGSHPNGNSALNEFHPTEAPQVTAAPIVAGVTQVATTVIDTELQLPGITVAQFTAAVQEGVIVAIAKQVGVHRSQVTLANIGASGGRRLLESAAGVSFDVIITIKSDAAAANKTMAKITSLATATASNAVERAHFSDVVAQEMVKAARASPTPPSAAVIETLAAVVVGVKKAPVDSTTSVKAGCYTKAHSCPNHKWASGSWNWHSHGTKQGKAYCLSDADNHHVSCGGDVTDPWSQKWVDNTGESVVTYPSPGCYWKLTTCPNHPGWLTTPANGGSSTNWKKHGIDDQARCIGSAWSHHKLCGLPETEVSATMFIGDENSDDATKATTHAVSCGVHREVKLPAVAVSMSSTHGSYGGSKCTNGNTDGHYDFCHSKKERAWIKLDLGETYATSSVVITNRKDCCQGRFDDHVIETSTDDVNWTQCFRGVLPHTSGSFTEGCKSEARYVRARMINPEYLNLQQVEVRGTPLCGISHKPHTSIAAPSAAATTHIPVAMKTPTIGGSWTCNQKKTLCYQKYAHTASMHDSINHCKVRGARVCEHNDMQELCGSGFNPYHSNAGWYGDHGVTSGGNWDDEFGTWNAGSCKANNDGPAKHAGSRYTFTCCRAGDVPTPGDGCPSDLQNVKTANGEICASTLQNQANAWGAIKRCKTLGGGAHVCTHNDMMQLAHYGNPWSGSNSGWYGDHGKAGGGNWDDEFGTWNSASYNANNDGPARHANTVSLKFRCCGSSKTSGGVSKSCPGGFSLKGTICYKNGSGSKNAHQAIDWCKGQKAHVCEHNEMQQMCGAGFNGYAGNSRGWYGDHGTKSNWDDEFGQWNSQGCGDNNDGPAYHATEVSVAYRCCTAAGI